MICIGLGKGQGSANKPPQSLSQRVVPSFNMGCLTRFFTNGLMLLSQQAKYLFIRFPEIAERGTEPISGRYPRPQTPTAFFATVTNEISNDLACTATQGYPNPAFVFLDSTNDHNSSNSRTSSGSAWANGGSSGNESAFSLSHFATVWRVTPNVRSRPRKLERS